MARARTLLPLLGGLAMSTPEAHAASTLVPSAFFVSKSENKNEVHYAIAVDENCLPVGAAPVRPYWLDREKGPGVTSPLLPREEPAYGIQSQSVTKREGTTGEITLTLRALPQRDLRITTGRAKNDPTCRAWTRLAIQGEAAQLYNVHVVIGFLGVDALILTGWADSDKRVLRETVKR